MPVELPIITGNSGAINCESLDTNRYLVTGGLLSRVVMSRSSFKLAGRPVFTSDNRSDILHTVLPKEGTTIPGIPPSTKITSTFWAGQCGTCGPSGVNHRINDEPRVFLYTDEHGPPMIGSAGDCCPTVRIEGGNFDLFQAFIMHNINQGLKIKEGSILIVALVTHLCRVGQELYLDQLTYFASEMAKLKLTVLPCLPPYPAGYDDRSMMNLHQFFIRLQACHYGNLAVANNLRFCLWEPLLKLALELKVMRTEMHTPHVRVHELGEDVLVSCASDFICGFNYKDGATWTHQIPNHVEQGFVTLLLASLEPILAGSKIRPVTPSPESVRAGMTRDFVDNCQVDGKSIFLIGSSILDRAAGKLIELAEPVGVEVVNMSQVGSYKVKFLGTGIDLSLLLAPLAQGSAEDVCIIHLMGNEMLMKKSVFPNRTTTHLSNPKILPDQAAKDLIKDMEKFVHFARSTMGFPGKIIVVGPQPRHLVGCCGQVKHKIVALDKKEVDMKLYTDTFNKYAQETITLSDNVEFIRYDTIHGAEFKSDNLLDGVHLGKDAERAFAHWLMSTLERKHSPAVAPCANAPAFSTMLNAVKIAAVDPTEMEQ